MASVEVLSIADVLPFPVERDTEVGEDARLRYRYLDLRRGPIVERLAMRARFAQLVRSHLGERGFLEVQTPVLTASSPEGARDFLVPSRLYPGEFYALPQAPQQFKQLLMVSGVERYFQIAPCFRDESSRADRSPGEFYQIDLEMAFATQEDVFAEVELLMTRVVDELTTKRANAEWPHLSYADAVDRYGTDKPDLRFGLEIAELTTELGGRTELPMFTEAPAAGRVIRALRAQGAADRSRKWFDAYADAARKAGAIGSWLQLDPAGTKGPLAKKLTEEEIAAIVTATGAEPGDAVLTAVGPRPAAAAALGEQRSTLGRELELADPTELSFCWVVDFPMFEPDPDTGGWVVLPQPVLHAPGRPGSAAVKGPRGHPRLPVRPGVQRPGAVVGRSAQPPPRHHGDGVRHRRLRPGADPRLVPGPLERLPLRAAAHTPASPPASTASSCCSRTRPTCVRSSPSPSTRRAATCS